MSYPESKTDSRKARSDTTRNALMRAAEKLMAERGIENVTIRDIVTEAQQKNSSALQYHFSNRQGLIEAIHAERARETQDMREAMLEELMRQNPQPELRQLCRLMVEPAFALARSHVGFRRYIKAFGHELALSETSAFSKVGRQGVSGERLGALLRGVLPDLTEASYRRRLEAAVRLRSASMYHQARQRSAFQGKVAILFLNSLIDALVGLLSATESEETRAAARAFEGGE
tara:strand:- start:164 stop:856 length:693 start_codon:yes stop_codon:yes gene_type:complete